MPERLVQACLQVTEQVWQPMHLSRFITIASWAIGRISTPPPVIGGPEWAEHRDLVALAAGRSEVVEGERQLGVAADQMGRLEQQPGQRVMDATASTTDLGSRNVDDPVLGVVHEHRAL